jgi:hypothetical protein
MNRDPLDVANEDEHLAMLFAKRTQGKVAHDMT